MKVNEKFIRVKLSKKGNHVILQVEDKGLGIAREDIGRIFDKFYRARDERIRSLEGSGLGLFLVQHAVKAHGGVIKVSSEPGKGTSFAVLFPIQGVLDEADFDH